MYFIRWQLHSVSWRIQKLLINLKKKLSVETACNLALQFKVLRHHTYYTAVYSRRKITVKKPKSVYLLAYKGSLNNDRACPLACYNYFFIAEISWYINRGDCTLRKKTRNRNTARHKLGPKLIWVRNLIKRYLVTVALFHCVALHDVKNFFLVALLSM